MILSDFLKPASEMEKRSIPWRGTTIYTHLQNMGAAGSERAKYE
jgi:hypothetical protein